MKTLAAISVIGSDKAGVVARVTQFLFQAGANLEEVEQQVTRGLFSMSLQASWAKNALDRKQVETGLQRLAKSLGMEVRVRFLHEHDRPRLALLVTKEPGCAAAVIETVESKKIPAEIRLIASNHATLSDLATRAGCPFLHVDYADRDAAESKLLDALEKEEADFVVLARFMKILSPNFVWRYKNKIINIHPSLLPAFPGASAYRQAYERGVKVVGVTAHFVTMNLDEGPIICQDVLRVRPRESLESIIERGRELEAKTLVRAIQICLKSRLDIHWGVVHDV